MEKLAEQAICRMVSTKKLADIQDICDTLISLYGEKAADWTLDEVFKAALKREEALEKKAHTPVPEPVASQSDGVEEKSKATRTSEEVAIKLATAFDGKGQFTAYDACQALGLNSYQWNQGRKEALKSGLIAVSGVKGNAIYHVK